MCPHGVPHTGSLPCSSWVWALRLGQSSAMPSPWLVRAFLRTWGLDPQGPSLGATDVSMTRSLH